jgi:GDP-L-fucose synthase
VNLGTGQEITIRDLAAMIVQETGYSGAVVFDPDKPNGQPRRCLDVSRAAAFGFQATRPLQEGIRETVAWYREHRAAQCEPAL